MNVFADTDAPPLDQQGKCTMKTKQYIIIQWFIIFISCILASCAAGDQRLDSDQPAADSGRSDCIFRSSIRGYTVLDESNLIVDASGRSKYHVRLQRRAVGMRSSWNIGLESSTSRICAGFSKVVFKGHMGIESIRIASIRELGDDEVEDLLIQFGKKDPEIEQIPAPKEVQGAEVEELDTAATDDSSGN